MLDIGQDFFITWSIDGANGRKGLIVSLDLAEETSAELGAVADGRINTNRPEAGCGAVLLQDCAVIPRLGEIAALQEKSSSIRKPIPSRGADSRMLGVRGGVHATALRRRQKNEAISLR